MRGAWNAQQANTTTSHAATLRRPLVVERCVVAQHRRRWSVCEAETWEAGSGRGSVEAFEKPNASPLREKPSGWIPDRVLPSLSIASVPSSLETRLPAGRLRPVVLRRCLSTALPLQRATQPFVANRRFTDTIGSKTKAVNRGIHVEGPQSAVRGPQHL